MKTASTGLPCLLFLALTVAGCSFAPRKPFVPAAPPPNTAAVYFYRPSEMTGRLLKPTLSVNGAKLGRLANDSYGVAYLPPGAAHLNSLWPGLPGSRRDDSVDGEFLAGRNYYFRVRYHVGKPRNLTPAAPHLGALSFEDRAGLEEVGEDEAAGQMAGMAPTDTFPAFHPAGVP
jgi:hypothetical protein